MKVVLKYQMKISINLLICRSEKL